MSRDETGKQGNTGESEPTLKSGEETQSVLKYFFIIIQFASLNILSKVDTRHSA